MHELNSCAGPVSFEEMYPAVVDTILKNHFPMAVRANPFLREACVAGIWLGIVTHSDRNAAQLLSSAIRQGLDASRAATSVARGLGWVEGQVVKGWDQTAMGQAATQTS